MIPALVAGLVAACSAPVVDQSPVTVPQRPGAVRVSERPPAEIAGCPLLSERHVLRAEVDHLPVARNSTAMIAAAGGSDRTVLALFSSTVREGSRRGIPVNVLDGRTTPRRDLVLSTAFGEWSDNGIPWPEEPRFEGWPNRAWDRRLLVLDSASCEFWEAINLQTPEENPFAAMAGTWYADKVVRWDPQAPAPRSHGSITGSGLPFLPALVRYEEVAAGSIDHALLATLPAISDDEPVWPATRNDGRNEDPNAPPMGSWLRLRADADLSELGPQARVVAEALRTHGMILSDSAPHLGLRGEPDVRWDDDDLEGLSTLSLADFEVVEHSSLMSDPESWIVP